MSTAQLTLVSLITRCHNCLAALIFLQVEAITRETGSILKIR
jgi:hypothetical protein